MDSKSQVNEFLPSFGIRPARLIGRSEVVSDFLYGLDQQIGHRQRATMLIGQRGTGKTSLLLEFDELAEAAGFVSARVTASEDMLDDIIQTIQSKGAKYFPKKKRKVTGVSAGIAGFSFGLTFSEEVERQYGFRIKMELLCDRLAEVGKGVLILVDEVQPNTSAIRSLVTNYQHLIGDGKNIAMVLAGLPSSISAVLNDDILTFLNRGYKVRLEPLPLPEVSLAYTLEFEKHDKEIDSKTLREIVEATKGHPYLYQLIGYYLMQYSQNHQEISSEITARAINASRQEMTDNVFLPILNPLSARDKDFLNAMAIDEVISSTSDLEDRMEESANYIQRYRSRLIDAGVIVPTGIGKLTFAVPYLREYLRGEFEL